MSMAMNILSATPPAGYCKSSDPLFESWQESVNLLPQFTTSQVTRQRMDGGDDKGLHILSILPLYQSPRCC